MRILLVSQLYPGLTAVTTRRWANDHARELVGYTRALLQGAGSVPCVEQVMASLEVVRQLRQDMTGVTAGLERYVDLSYMQEVPG